MPRVLITGAAGFIGMHTSIRFLREGWEVIGLDNMNDYYSVSLKKSRLKQIKSAAIKQGGRFDMFEFDLNSEIWRTLESFEFESVIHLAAQAGVRYSIENPRVYLESNILGFQNVIEFVERQSIGCFIYASSSSVYGKSSKQPFCETEPCNQPESYYAATKKSNELMAQSYFKTKHLKSLGLRFFTVYGPWGRPDMAPYIFAESAFTGKSIEVFNFGNQKRDFTYIDDIVEGIYLSVLNFDSIKGAEILNLGFGSPTQLMDFIATIEKYCKKPLNKNFREAQLGDVQCTYASLKKIKKFIPFKPSIGIDKGVREFVNWLENYNDLK